MRLLKSILVPVGTLLAFPLALCGKPGGKRRSAGLRGDVARRDELREAFIYEGTAESAD